MKTSKIKEVVDVTGDGVSYNGTYYHNLVMDNGDKINIGKKKRQDIGNTLTYEIIEEGQHEYSKSKSVSPQSPGYSQPTQFKADPEKQASIELQVCLKEANLYHATHGFSNSDIISNEDELVNTTKYLYDNLFKK